MSKLFILLLVIIINVTIINVESKEFIEDPIVEIRTGGFGRALCGQCCQPNIVWLISNQRDNMKIEIDIKEIVQKIDINKLIEEKIMSDVSDAIDIENIVDKALDNEEVKNHLNKRVIDIIDNYMNSEEGKNRIMEAFNNTITDSDILNDDKVIELVAEFLKKNLRI